LRGFRNGGLRLSRVSGTPKVPRVTRGHPVTRFAWGLADQSLSSLTNFAAAALVARTAGVQEFGVFAVAFATYTLGLGISRAATGEPIVARFSGLETRQWRIGVRASTGTAILLGLFFGLVCLTVSATTLGGSFRATFAMLGLTFPGLILQDAWRYAFFASANNRRAFSNDLVWTILLAFGLVFALLERQHSAAQFMLIWGLSATGAGLAGCLQSRLIPGPRHAARWIREQSDLGARFLGEFLALTGATQLMLYGLAILSGVAAVGAIRGGIVSMGPLNILLMGVTLVAVPEAVRVSRAALGHLWKYCVTLSVILAGVAVAWGFVVILIPDSLGRLVLGETWDAARPTLFPVALWIAGNGVVAGAMAGLRALQAASHSLRAQVVSASARLLLGLAGGAFAGAAGAAWGVAAATLGTSVIWWIHLSKALHERGTLDMTSVENSVHPSAALDER
jgi:O-antigen/teichoic acid export membrane protein